MKIAKNPHIKYPVKYIPVVEENNLCDFSLYNKPTHNPESIELKETLIYQSQSQLVDIHKMFDSPLMSINI